MANATLPPQTTPTTHSLSPTAGILSYLVPGLGQIAQGRVGKGLLFLICIYTLFFYGLYLGSGSVTLDGQTYRVSSNVYLPDNQEFLLGLSPSKKDHPAVGLVVFTPLEK